MSKMSDVDSYHTYSRPDIGELYNCFNLYPMMYVYQMVLKLKTGKRMAVLLFWPKHRFGHPEYYVIMLPKQIFCGSKYTNNI